MKLSYNTETSYEQKDGILLGSNLFDEQQFVEIFKELLRDKQQTYRETFLPVWLAAKKWVSIVMTKGETQSVTTVISNLQQVASAFAQFVGGDYGQLGGDISLMTTFNFGDQNQEIYYLPQEDTLSHKIDETTGELVYNNTQQTLEKLIEEGKDIQRVNESLKSHLNLFNTQLRNRDIYNKGDYPFLRAWSYYNMRERHDKISKQYKSRVSLARYFWGGGQWAGYISEAYAAHLAMKHPDFMQQHAAKLMSTIPSVVEEHGGPGSPDLYSLLKSTKGNTSSQLSGDVVVIDGEGNVKFNIQSKASRRGAYGFTITYKQFMRNIMKFMDLYEACTEDESLAEQSAKEIFNMFKTQAWVPVQQKAQEEVNKEIKKIMSDYKLDTKT